MPDGDGEEISGCLKLGERGARVRTKELGASLWGDTQALKPAGGWGRLHNLRIY